MFEVKNMGVNIHNLIAAISPDIYCDPSVKSEAKDIAKDKGYLEAAKKAKPKEIVFMDLVDIAQNNASDAVGLKAPCEKHTLIYDSFGEGLEPIYFWILDMIQQRHKNVEKLVDNFVAAPGSTHFAEMGQRATRMQEEAMKIFGAINQVVKSILNIIYDLKEFKIRLKVYDEYRDNHATTKNAALLTLKQIWMDTVDIKKGTTALKGLIQNFDYATIIDAFMAAKTIDDVTLPVEKGGIDLNERVRRILQQRVGEFFRWITESEQELRKRFEIEKIYLKSQVNTIKMYSRWVKPYLNAARALEQRMNPDASLVNAFNTTLFELVIMGEGEYDPSGDIANGNLPKLFKNVTKKKYTPLIIIEFKYRTSPERAQQGYGFRGRVEVTFSSYALTTDEVKVFKEELSKDDMNEMIKFIEGSTDESLKNIQIDLDELLEDKKPKEEKEEKEKEEGDTNPFSALFSLFKGEKKEEKKDDGKTAITSDNQYEKILRSQAIISARKTCYSTYDLYKKAHQMASLPGYD